MGDQEYNLLAIEVDADDYAETAASDTPSVPRTYQSEADFEAVKATYIAKLDGNNTYRDLMEAVPSLSQDNEKLAGEDGVTNGHSRVKLSKREGQLLHYAVGELYYDKDYAALIDLYGWRGVGKDVVSDIGQNSLRKHDMPGLGLSTKHAICMIQRHRRA